ncbi:MAG: hypothetical protein R2705_09430 [Ilumatobacteraceae bacterium]
MRNNSFTDPEWWKTLKPGWQAGEWPASRPWSAASTRTRTSSSPTNGRRSGGTDTQREPATPEEAAELERHDFGSWRPSVNGSAAINIRRPPKLKPWYGKHCKRVTFHDDYLESFNRLTFTWWTPTGWGRTGQRRPGGRGEPTSSTCLSTPRDLR